MPKQNIERDAIPGDIDDVATSPQLVATFGEVAARRYSRRTVLRGLGAGALAGGVAGLVPLDAGPVEARARSSLTFEELAHGTGEDMAVAPGYRAEVVIRWGDKVARDAPTFDAANVSASAQRLQFGYNNDFIGYFPLPAGSARSDHGLLVVNHEYTNPELMFSGITKKTKLDRISKTEVEAEMAAHGLSVVEVKREAGRWRTVHPSGYARRLTASETTMIITGPAAGHDKLKTAADPSGTKVIGTIGNCAGGVTPWGTVLSAEENFNLYFGGDPTTAPDARSFERYGVAAKPAYAWSKYYDRFNVDKEPNEPNRFGWVVEFDPYDPAGTPKKRTALGRFKHEGATVAVNGDGRAVVYSGDDQRFDYLYRFVSNARINAADPAANRDLLDDGTLAVARFDEDGTLSWLPLVHGEGPLTADNGFASQADVLINTRLAADLLGATPMDRPEDVEPSPTTGRVYLALTNNTKRKADDTDAANPRGPNPFGHVVELLPPGEDGRRDHAADTFRWEIFIKAGDHRDPSHDARYHPETTANGWLAAPDNVAIDPSGRLWITTDQGGGWRKTAIADGVYACDTAGPARGLTRHIFRVPYGAEMCGPAFTPDGTTLFVAVQHPGADGVEDDRNFDNPITRWPDFADGVPPRPSVVAITREDDGAIGG